MAIKGDGRCSLPPFNFLMLKSAEGSGLMAVLTYKAAQAVACFGQVVYSVLQMPQGDSCGLLLDPSSVPSVGLPSDQCQILSLRESDGMRLTTAESGPNNRVHFSFNGSTVRHRTTRRWSR